MMTGTTGVLMWIMMIVMLAGMAVGGITWTRRHLMAPRSGKPRSADPGQSSSDHMPRTGSGGQAPLP